MDSLNRQLTRVFLLLEQNLRHPRLPLLGQLARIKQHHYLYKSIPSARVSTAAGPKTLLTCSRRCFK
ncbi:hypothetical protein DPMN_082562 [Dreissena polymorpha]|uniref:Uncharacterized protein n=1 Tax=Dreissena polymorpha TaxID=45954 RepID=A0A9D4BA92_DREPO|nr:hypothetical protein DPMN_082562 [Dreissena polymorpha]